MSLVVWLPLTKDLRNQGLINWTPTLDSGTTATFESGKLGQALGTGGITMPASVTKQVLNNEAFSFACWIYVKGTTGSTSEREMIFGNGGMNELGGRQFSLFQYPTCNDLHWSWQNYKNGSYSGAWTSVLRGVLPSNTWTHLVVTYKKGSNTTFYINGEVKYTGTYTSDADTFEFDTKLIWDSAYHRLNDVRLYDHCLSPMEVKQISQGLVLHYPLDNNGFGNENLLSNDKNNWGKYTCGSGVYGSSGSRFAPYQITIPILSSTKYICHIADYLKLGQQLYVGVHQLSSDLTFLNDSGWKAVPYTFTSLSNAAYVRLTFRDALNNATNIQTYLDNIGEKILIKFEKGDKATLWCPNSSDELATTMGLSSTTEYDCSGFCNNGTRTGTFSWTSNTPKYVVSQVFNGTDNAIQTPSLPTMISDKNYTVACWTYKTVIGTKNYQTIYGGPSGFELEARSSSSTSPLYRIHNWGGGTTAYNFGEWTHFCFVHTDSDSKLYVNGELKITGTSVNIPSGNYFVGAWNTSTQQNFEGSMSDFRIYATALSASDVKSLYQNSAYIDSSENVYGAIHSEV